MTNKKKQTKLIKILDEVSKLPNKVGNGILRTSLSVDEKGKLQRYSLAYINTNLCHVDNGRVLGYDNSHGYHHRHYMGKEEAVDFVNYESIAEKFNQEWRLLHEKAKKHHR